MDNSASDEQAKEDYIQGMLDEHRRLKTESNLLSSKERLITQKIQNSMPDLTPKEAQEQARRLLWIMCINDWDEIAL
ncbi:hypothetical protein [Pseudanabaena sp. FACHB-2040]|uniref:hypothetical protein n=1 Tax=Pseudanabaena sp. FACHB-2040 TaxID=2692859 RepID=UPI001686503C|nr:hypothetical protein [Pseudanabaena sp. FACHB-2040]MBD2256291.1 hypothetical protein [Pseudanabaena sp. FACHB-2040]